MQIVVTIRTDDVETHRSVDEHKHLHEMLFNLAEKWNSAPREADIVEFLMEVIVDPDLEQNPCYVRRKDVTGKGKITVIGGKFVRQVLRDSLAFLKGIENATADNA